MEIFFLRQHSAKPDTPARAEHRASLRLQTQGPTPPAADFAVVGQALPLPGLPCQADAAPALQEFFAIREISRRRARDEPPDRLR